MPAITVLLKLLVGGLVPLVAVILHGSKKARMLDDLYTSQGGIKMPPKTIAALLVCRIVIICLIAALSIVAISIFCPHDNNKDTITVLLGFLSASIVGLLSLAKAQENAYLIQTQAEKNAELIAEHTQLVSQQFKDLKLATSKIATKAEDIETAEKLKEVN
jgi:hypothetical protein